MVWSGSGELRISTLSRAKYGSFNIVKMLGWNGRIWRAETTAIMVQKRNGEAV